MVCVGVDSCSSAARSEGLGESSLKVIRILSANGTNPSRRAKAVAAASSLST